MKSLGAEKLTEYLKKASEQESHATLEWYLKQIRELVAKGIAANTSTLVPPASIGMDAPSTKREEERKDVRKNYVIETTSQFNQSYIGKMMFFSYDPKLKATLPYYDRFPLIFPLSVDRNGTLGMNMHYLPPKERAFFMTALYSLLNTTELHPNSKLLLTYKLLKNSSKLYYYKPCIKRYLHSHVTSRLSVIDPEEWNHVLFLPLAQFMKASEFKVWQDSIAAIRKFSNIP